MFHLFPCSRAHFDEDSLIGKDGRWRGSRILFFIMDDDIKFLKEENPPEQPRLNILLVKKEKRFRLSSRRKSLSPNGGKSIDVEGRNNWFCRWSGIATHRKSKNFLRILLTSNVNDVDSVNRIIIIIRGISRSRSRLNVRHLLPTRRILHSRVNINQSTSQGNL
ncbi:hypothetical protein Tco_0217655 [Tanacetum coccineum]